MVHPTVSARLIASGIIALPAIYLAVRVYRRVVTTPSNRVTTHQDVSTSLKESATVTRLVNPRSLASAGDARFIDLDVTGRAREVGDEALLSAFVRGFFGGVVFGPERFVLDVARPKFTNFPELDRSTARHIWDTSNLVGDKVPPRHTILFGAFQVSDICLRRGDAVITSASEPTESTIDFVYGSNTGQFAGTHRFSVSRGPGREGSVRVAFESFICNPSVNQPLGSGYLFKFHGAYAAMLFREAVGEVQRRILVEGG